METMRAEIAAQPPVEGAYSARRGDYCIAKFADGEWYVGAVKRYKLFSTSEHQVYNVWSFLGFFLLL